MVTISGGRSGSVTRLKKEFERSSGDRTWIKGIKAGQDLTVRFLTEPDEWYAYREHYDPSVHFFPCIGRDNECPGCEHESEKVQRTSRRYLANVLDVEEGRVLPIKLPLDLAQRLVARYERNGDTLLNRDYTLHRMGKGLDTTYDVTPEDKSKVDVDQYEQIDLEQALVQQFEDAFDLESSVDEDAGPRKQKESPSNIDTESDVDDDVPSEPSPSPDEDDEDGYLTEEEALKLDKDQLKALADQMDIEIDGRWSKEKMVDKIFSEAG